MMLQCTRDLTVDGEEFRAGSTRVAADHPVAKRNPGAFRSVSSRIGEAEVRVTDHGGKVIDTRRQPVERELRQRREALAETETEADRIRRRFGIPESEEARVWRKNERLLERDRKRREPVEEGFDGIGLLKQVDAAAAERKLDQLDEMWRDAPGGSPLRR